MSERHFAVKQYTPEQRVEKFLSRVDRSPHPKGCHLWTAGTMAKGYGWVRWDGRMRLAHRVAFEIAHGARPPDDLCVLHSCDIRTCVNPDHLFLGTNLDNIEDMVQKGRQRAPRGERSSQSKLTDRQVAEIRQRYAAGGVTYRQLSAEYGVGKGHIGLIVRLVSRT